MNLKFKITCSCHCSYTVNEKINTNKILCPNCGSEYPYSEKLIYVLKTANEISEEENGFGNSPSIQVITLSEELSIRQ